MVSQSWIAEYLGMKNAADLSSVINRVDLSRSEKKVPETLRGFVSEKMKGNEPEPPVLETGSIDFKKT